MRYCMELRMAVDMRAGEVGPWEKSSKVLGEFVATGWPRAYMRADWALPGRVATATNAYARSHGVPVVASVDGGYVVLDRKDMPWT